VIVWKPHQFEVSPEKVEKVGQLPVYYRRAYPAYRPAGFVHYDDPATGLHASGGSSWRGLQAFATFLALLWLVGLTVAVVIHCKPHFIMSISATGLTTFIIHRYSFN